MRQLGFISAAILFLLLGIAVPGRAQNEAKSQPEERGKGQAKGQAKVKVQQPEQPAAALASPEPQPQGRTQPQQRGQQQQADQNRQAPKQQQARQLPPGQYKKQARLPKERQQQLIVEQQQRVTLYRQRLDQQQIAAQQYVAQLQQEKRMANYRIQQEYLERLRQQQVALQRTFDYNNDPYFYSAPTYRYNRGGTDYQINEYGANSLRQAVNYGYAEGFRAGQADQQDGWRFDFRNAFGYRDANYGYDGYYGDQEGYNYYFREGFRRGYEDGYYSRSQYGQASNGSYSVLGAILSQVLNLQSLF